MSKRIYKTKAWKMLRKIKLHNNPWCEYCPEDIHTIATVVDHVMPIRLGGEPYDLANLSSCCAPCHNRKTARGAEHGAVKTIKPIKGCDENGYPLDVEHPWNTGDKTEKSLRATAREPALGTKFYLVGKSK